MVNKVKKHQNFINLFLLFRNPLGLGATSFLLLLPFARIDFDRSHDGAMYPMVSALQQGLTIHKDVGDWYGPILPWFQAIFSLLPFPTALEMRLLNIALISITIAVLSSMGNQTPTYWPISKNVAVVSAISWLVLCDVFSWIPMLPWASVLACTLTTISLKLIASSLYHAERVEIRLANRRIFVSGILLGLTFFTKINVGLLSILAALVVYFIARMFCKNYFTNANFLLYGMSVGLGSATLLLLIQGALPYWWSQCIVYPALWAAEAAQWFRPLYALPKIFVGNLVPIAMVVFATLIYQKNLKMLSGLSSKVWGFSVSTAIAIFYYLDTNSPKCFQFPCTLGGEVTFGGEGISSHLARSNLNLLYFFGSLFVAGVLFFLVQEIPKVIKTKKLSHKNFSYVIVIGFALAQFLQIYPLYDSRHIWWGLPLAILFTFSVFTFEQKQSNKHRSHQATIAVSSIHVLPLYILLASLLSGVSYLNMDRIPAQNNSISSGILNPPGLAKILADNQRFIAKHCSEDRDCLFFSTQGYYAAINQKYLASDRFFVTGLSGDDVFRLQQADKVVIDNYRIVEVEKVLLGEKFRLVDSNESISLYKRPN